MIQVKKSGSTTTLSTLEYNGKNITEAWFCDKTARTCTKVFPTMCITIPALASNCDFDDFQCTLTNTGTDQYISKDMYGIWCTTVGCSCTFTDIMNTMISSPSGYCTLTNSITFQQSPAVPLVITGNTSIPGTFCVTASYCFKERAYGVEAWVTNCCSCPNIVSLCGAACPDCHCFFVCTYNPMFTTTYSHRVTISGAETVCLPVPICALASGSASASGLIGTPPKWYDYVTVDNKTIAKPSCVCRCLVFTLNGNEVYNSGWQLATRALSFCM